MPPCASRYVSVRGARSTVCTGYGKSIRRVKKQTHFTIVPNRRYSIRIPSSELNNASVLPSPVMELNNLRKGLGMKVRILIAVTVVAVALHALIFVALGRLAKNQGSLVPSFAAPPTAAPHSSAQSPAPEVHASRPSGAMPVTTAPSNNRSRHPARAQRRSMHDAASQNANPAPALPVFDVNEDAASTGAALDPSGG